MKLKRSLFLIDLNQSITAAVFFHWCKFGSFCGLIYMDLFADLYI